METTWNIEHSVFAKTSVGQQEISQKTLGLTPLQRRLLILVDGKRGFAELLQLLAGQDLRGLFSELIGRGCIEPSASVATPPAQVVAAVARSAPALDQNTPTGAAGVLRSLPDASLRSAKEIDMARNFMINTLTMTFGHHHCVSLVDALHNCTDSIGLRDKFLDWYKLMESTRSSAKELPSLVKRLTSVL
jgi:hypothetical protein